MLDALRRGAKTWVAKILLVMLMASFAAWGVADFLQYAGTPQVAEVGDTEIPLTDFQRAYDRQVQSMSRQLGQPVDRDFAAALGIPRQVLSRLISDATLTETASSMGLGISDEALAKEITEDPQLRPPGSENFDRSYFVRLLRENGLSEQAYIAERRVQSMRGQLMDGLVGGITPPKAWVEIAERYRTEQRDIRYAVLPAAAAGPVPVANDADLDTWYTDNKVDFRAPEYRQIEILSVTPEALADPSTVGEDTARAEYERTKAAFTEPEKRRVRQLLFPSLGDAEAAAAKIRTGQSLDAVIAELGMSPVDVDLGLIPRSEIIDPAIADVAFSLEPNVVSDPIDARFGSALVEVTEIVPEAARPFEEVADEVRQSIATRLAEQTVLDSYNEIEDARAGGATFAEISQRFGLPLQTVETDARGTGRDGAVITPIPSSGEVLDAAFAAEEGDEHDPIRAGRGFVWFQVTGVTPAADRPLADVRDQVVEAWTAEKTAEALAAKADELADAVRAGGDLEALATAAGGSVNTAEDLTRTSQHPDFGQDGIAAVFAGPVGHVGTVSGVGSTQVVLQVTDVSVPAFFAESAESQQVAEQLSAQLGDSLLGLYIDRAGARLGSSVNEQAVDSVLGGAAIR